MIEQKVLDSLQFNIILDKVREGIRLPFSAPLLYDLKPFNEINDVNNALELTSEMYNAMFFEGFNGVEYFDDVTILLQSCKRGMTLSMGELLKVCALLRSSRLCKTFISDLSENFPLIKEKTEKLYYDNFLEKDISFKIISDEQMSDNASELLAEIRKQIKNLNFQIREKLQYYIRNKSEFLQDNIVTIRENRYVIPVKSEYKTKIQGFVHDQSASGSTFFIEPIEVLEMNNKLKSAVIEEENEINRILGELSGQIGMISSFLEQNIQILVDIDILCAKAMYAYRTKAVKPYVVDDGTISIKEGKHPLIDVNCVVPIDISLGGKYNFLLISGPNTGGKTVSLKLVGLFTVMACSGLFIQANEQSKISVFKSIYTDIGDEQSIENSLSTFSSHLKNIIEVAEKADNSSLVLFDEIGGGTNPDEGIALAKAVLDTLFERGAYGIITTHYTALKEYAFDNPKIINAGMEFDSVSFKPLYKIKIGSVGTSNALAIAKRLGLSEFIVNRATDYLSDSAKEYEKIINNAEQERRNALALYEKNKENEEKSAKILKELEQEKEEFIREKEKFLTKSKVEAKRLVNEKIEEADDLVGQIKEILDKAEIDTGDLIRAKSLKNKLENSNYYAEDDDFSALEPLSVIKPGDRVFVQTLGKNATVIDVNEKKGRATVKCDSGQFTLPISSFGKQRREKNAQKVTVSKPVRSFEEAIKNEINVIGQSSEEAVINVGYFIDKAIYNNFEEVKIIHGKGLNVLSKAIHAYLKTLSCVKSFRFGKYGEGESGVTIVTLK